MVYDKRLLVVGLDVFEEYLLQLAEVRMIPVHILQLCTVLNQSVSLVHSCIGADSQAAITVMIDLI